MASTTEQQTTKCLRCSRTLTSAASITRGYGRTCGARIKAAAKVVNVAEFKDGAAPLAKATQLIEDAAIIPTRIPSQYLATSSDGLTVYLVDTLERSCTCKGHTRCGHCYHLVAADALMMNAAPVRRAA